jgi:hypothetical protein
MMRAWLLALCIMMPQHVAAQAISAEDEAEWSGAKLAKILPGPNRYFYNAYADGCPVPTLKCRDKAYLVAGDMVVALETKGRFTRVEFVNAKGRSRSGWIENAGLGMAPPIFGGWAGLWRGTEQSITIKPTRKTGLFRASGDATWGAGDPDRVARGGVHIGSFSGDIMPENGQAALSDDGDSNGCQIKLRLLGPYLLVTDNLQCGGMNVRFYGALRKMP